MRAGVLGAASCGARIGDDRGADASCFLFLSAVRTRLHVPAPWKVDHGDAGPER